MKKRLLLLTVITCILLCGCGKDEDDVVNSSQGAETETENLLPSIGAEDVSAPDGNGALPEYEEVDRETALAALKSVAEEFESSETQSSNNGSLVFKSYVFDDSKAHVLLIDLDKYTLKAALPYDKKIDGSLQSIEGQIAVAEKNGLEVVAGIAANETHKATNIPCGTVISEGKTVYTVGTDDGSVFIGLYSDGKAFCCTRKEYEEIYRNKVSEMVSATHIIVKDGKALDIAGSVYEEKTVRTGGGFSADRGTFCLVYGENIDLETLSNLLIANSCSVGVNFDSGRDTGFVYDKLYGTGAPEGPTLLIAKK